MIIYVQNMIARIQVYPKQSNHALITVVAGWLKLEQCLVIEPELVVLMLN